MAFPPFTGAFSSSSTSVGCSLKERTKKHLCSHPATPVFKKVELALRAGLARPERGSTNNGVSERLRR